ncbi:MAG: hypothetical protein ACK5NC_14860 [Vibrio sp.]
MAGALAGRMIIGSKKFEETTPLSPDPFGERGVNTLVREKAIVNITVAMPLRVNFFVFLLRRLLVQSLILTVFINLYF